MKNEKLKAIGITLSLSALLFVHCAQAFAWLTHEQVLINDVGISGLAHSEPCYAALYGSNTLVFGAAETIPETYAGSNLTAAYEDIGAMRYARYTEVPWYRFRSNIRSVDAVDRVQPMYIDYWFYGFNNCSSFNLERIDASRMLSMTYAFCQSGIDDASLETLGDWKMGACTDISYAFMQTKISSIEPIEDWNTGSVRAMRSCFNNCQRLVDLDLARWDVSSAQDLYGLFYGCTALKSVGDLSAWNTSSARDLGNMFRNAYELTSIGDCTNWDTSHVENMTSMFQECYVLEGLACIAGWDTSSVEQMSGMLRGCTKITSLDLSGWNVSRVKYMSYMFADCGNLEAINTYGWRLSCIEDLQQTFGGCYNLHKIEGIGTWEVGETLSSLWMTWIDCASLESLDLTTWSVTPDLYATDALANCVSLEALIIPSTFSVAGNLFFPSPNISHIPTSDGLWYKSGTGHGFNAAKATEDMQRTFKTSASPTIWMLASDTKAYAALYGNDDSGYSLVFGRGDAENSFEGRELQAVYLGIEGDTRDFSDEHIPWKSKSAKITEIISEAIDTKIEPMHLKGYFADATWLRSADLTALNTTHVTDMSRMFYGCTSLEDIDVSSFDTSHVSLMTYIFTGCISIRNLSLNVFNTSKVEVFESMFQGCSSLEQLDISTWSTASTTSLASMFSECSSLAKLALPASFVSNHTTSISLMFNDCCNLSTIQADTWDTSHIENFSYAFNNCRSLAYVEGIEWWHTGNARTMTQMFGMCPLLSADLSHWDVEAVMEYTGFSAGSPHIVSPFELGQAISSASSDGDLGLSDAARDISICANDAKTEREETRESVAQPSPEENSIESGSDLEVGFEGELPTMVRCDPCDESDREAPLSDFEIVGSRSS